MRPIPTYPRGRVPNRRRPLPHLRAMIGIPRLSPEWELSALHALMKPKEITKAAIRHAKSRQPWPPQATAIVEDIIEAVTDRLGFEPAVHFPAAGDFHALIEADSANREDMKALAVALSSRLPGVWLSVGRVLVRDGRFFRRAKGYKLNLVPATNVHLTRPIRSALRGLL